MLFVQIFKAKAIPCANNTETHYSCKMYRYPNNFRRGSKNLTFSLMVYRTIYTDHYSWIIFATIYIFKSCIHHVYYVVFNMHEEILTHILPSQINGIALDNKSVTECEALLRGCRDSLSLSLMKVSVFQCCGCVCVLACDLKGRYPHVVELVTNA